MRIGLMGCGSVASFGHVPAILRTEGLELAGLYDPNPERLKIFNQHFGERPSFTSEEEFWDQGYDSVSICSPAPAHHANVLAAAQRGVPVLCEKPIAMSDDDGEEMAQAMEATDLPFGIGYCYRFAGIAQRIREMVSSGAIGEVRSLRLQYIWNLHGVYEPGPEGQTYSPARRARMEEGGPMVDCGVHMIDLARWWLGSEVVRVHGEGAWVENYPAPDQVYAHLTHANGVHTAVEMSFTYTHTAKEPISYFHYHLIGTDGVILYDRDAGRFEVRTSRGTEYPGWTHEKNFDGMYSSWKRVLETRELGDFPTARDGILATQIAWDATQQAMAHRVPQVNS